MNEAQFQAEAAKIIAEYDLLASQDNGKWVTCPRARPHDMERVLRSDILMNEAEDAVCGIKVQIRLKDTSGKKPYLIAAIEADPITGCMSISQRNDRGGNGSRSGGINHFDLKRADKGGVGDALALQYAIILLKRDGYQRDADVLTRMLANGRGLGWPICTSRFHDRLYKMYIAAPDYDRSPLIHEGKMEPGRWYAVAEIPPIGQLRLTLLRFESYCEIFPDTSRELWVRHDQTAMPLELRLDHREVVSGPTRSNLGTHTSRDYRGKVFEVTEELVRELEAFVSPHFDSSTDEQIGMPVWDKPLDSIENCLERIRTQKYGFDREQYEQSVMFLFEHRDDLTEAVAVTVPSMTGHSFVKTDEERWQQLIANTTSSCGCGVHRTIMSSQAKTVLEPDLARRTTVAEGKPLYLTPKGREKEQALVKVEVTVQDGQHFLSFVDRPFSGVLDIKALFFKDGYSLTNLAEAMRQKPNDKPRLINKDKQPLFNIDTVDLTAGTVTIVPDADLDVLSE